MSQTRIAQRLKESKKAKRKKQLVIITVLVCGLLIAVITQPRDEESSTAIGLATAPVSGRTVSARTGLPLLDGWVWKTEKRFQPLEKDLLLSHSLFPSEKEQVFPSESGTTAPPRSQRQVRAVYGSAEKTSALVLVGDSSPEIMHHGEFASGGQQVLIDDREGVKLILPQH